MITPLAINLPYPPSVNRIWRSNSASAGKQVYIAPSYVKWKNHADALLMSQRGWMLHRVTGQFEVEIALCPPKGHQRGDLDNRIKAILDFLQRATIVSNDKHCQRITAYWAHSSTAPEGCRVTVTPWQTVNDVLRASAERLEGVAS
jgi:Holliday junction resolvase RusA-like endonuclease